MIIDLFSGLGYKRWPTVEPVIGLDLDPKTEPTIICSIKDIPLRENLKPRLCHASPPCTYFSLARARSKGWEVQGIAESLELVAACFKAFVHLRPHNWTIENPVGKLGQIFNLTRLNYGKSYDYQKKPTHFLSNMRGLRRAVIPDHIRQHILDTVELQP